MPTVYSVAWNCIDCIEVIVIYLAFGAKQEDIEEGCRGQFCKDQKSWNW